MRKVSGTFNGTGAIVNVGIGFRPDSLYLRNLDSASVEEIRWNRGMSRIATCMEGIKRVAGTDTELTIGVGVKPYRGGDIMAAASTAYLVADPHFDKRALGTAGTPKLWTLDTAANRTGHLDKLISTTYVGVGSRILIRHTDNGFREYAIVALSNDGDAANDITLDVAAPTGEVAAIYGMYDYIGAAAGATIPAGFTLAADADMNASGETIYFEAELHE